MYRLAAMFFWLHTALCVAYVFVMFSAAFRAMREGRLSPPRAKRLGGLLVVGNDKVLDLMTYLVFGLFLLYAEVYIYRVYDLALLACP